MAYTEAFIQLANGSYFQAVNTMYAAAMGSWWIIIPFVFTLLMAYIITKSDAVVSILGISGSAFLIFKGHLPITIHPLLYIIAALSMAMLLFRVFGKGE